MEVSGQFHEPAALPLGKEPWYPLKRRLGGPQSRSGCGGEEKNSQPPLGIEPPAQAAAHGRRGGTPLRGNKEGPGERIPGSLKGVGTPRC
jgi:hypothetical protein